MPVFIRVKGNLQLSPPDANHFLNAKTATARLEIKDSRILRPLISSSRRINILTILKQRGLYRENTVDKLLRTHLNPSRSFTCSVEPKKASNLYSSGPRRRNE